MSEEAERLVGCCGLYCGKCGVYGGGVIAKTAEQLKELIDAHGFARLLPLLGSMGFSFE